MQMAIREAENAARRGEVPIGAVIVAEDNSTILGRSHNLVNTNQDPTAHAEILAIRSAAKGIDNWRLLGATLYCTLEPCAMCLSAIQAARVRRVVYGAPDLRLGAVRGTPSPYDFLRFSHFLFSISLPARDGRFNPG